MVCNDNAMVCKRSLGICVGHRNAGRLLSIRPSIRPTCERDILRTISPIDFKFNIYGIRPPKIQSPSILGHLLKSKWPPSSFLTWMLWTTLVNAISLESFHQSTSDMIYDVIPPKGLKLLILGHNMLKLRCLPPTF